MKRAAALIGALLVSANPVLAQEPKPDSPAPDAPKPEAPRSDAERLRDLERQVEEQQRKIDALRKDEKPAPPPGAKEAKPGEDEDKLSLGYDEGFVLKGRLNGAAYEIRPVARVQLDYRAFPHAALNDAFPHTVPQDEFLMRRAAVGFIGKFDVFAFDLEADTVRPTTILPVVNFWLEWRAYKEVRLRFGHYKVPWDLEDSQTSDNYLDMVERPMVVGSNACVAPDFRPGVEVWGSISTGLFQYWLSCTNQSDSNAVPSGDPLTSVRFETNVSGFGLGIGGIWDNKSGIQNSFPGMTPGQYQFFAPVSVRGWTQRYVADACFYQGPFFARAEIVYASQERWRVLADHSNGTGLVTQGAVFTAGFLFWGPKRGPSRSPLAAPFKDWELFNLDIEKKKNARNVGAEIVFRAEWVRIDDTHGGRQGQGAVAARPSTAANADKVKGNDCKAVEVGLNLFPIENVRFMFNYVHLRIGDQSRAERPHQRFADELLFRAQLEF